MATVNRIHPAARDALLAVRIEREHGGRTARAYARKCGVFRLYVLARFLSRAVSTNS